MSKYISEEYEPEKEQKVKVKVSNEKISCESKTFKEKNCNIKFHGQNGIKIHYINIRTK